MDLQRRIGHLRSFGWKLTPLLVPVLIGLLKLVFALVIFYSPWKVHEPWNFYGDQTSPGWLYLFAAWDSIFYHTLATDWYPSSLNRLWAYFPVYPATIRLVALVAVDSWLAGILVVQIAGLASIFVFHKIAIKYLPKRSVAPTTALYFLLPPVFVFTTVTYSESLFLLLSLLTWYSHIKGREVASALFGSLTVLTRPYGLLIMVPMGYDYVRSKQFKNLAWLTFPLVTVAGWLSYGFSKTGNFLAPFSAQAYWNAETEIQIHESLNRFILHGDFAIFNSPTRIQLLATLSILFLIFITFLCIRAWKIDRSLGVYACTFLLVISGLAIALIQTLISLPRFLSLIFPAGISLGSRKKWLLRVALGTFAFLDLLGWWMFLFTETFH